jgi:N-acetylglucosaminyldiphosphoundecaprenol N-acetyl-beta-D-mannosaminyltransferase
MHSVNVLGVRVDDVTMEQALGCFADFIGTPGCHQIATVNPEFIMLARRNAEFARALAESDLNLPDGANLVRAARALGQPLRERVAGSDLIGRIAARSAESGWKIFLLGAGEGVAAQAAARLVERFPRLPIAGVWSGSPMPAAEDEQVERVNQSGAAILLVAYGAPAQDLWIARNRRRITPHAAMGVGGAFDFVAGRVPRAPLWVQQAGLEWLFRLTRQPWRLGRQLALFEFTWLVFRARYFPSSRYP